MAVAFGLMRTREAIPFLINNIALESDPVGMAPWLKDAGTIERTFPCIAALIQMGPDASREAIRAAEGQLSPEQRLAAIFVVSRVKNVPEAKAFLSSVIGDANQMRHWAEDGLHAIGDQQQH
jgi:hypothetical protein